MTVAGLGAVLRLLAIIEELDQAKTQNRGQSQGIDDLLNVLAPQRENLAKEGKKKVKKISSYHRKYGKEFKRLAPRYKKKNGSWKKNGFKLAAAAARKAAKK